LVPSLHVGRRLVVWLVPTLVYNLGVTLLVKFGELPDWKLGVESATALGVVLGMLLVFRNNAANDRWWEARKLWGQLINDSRTLILKVRAHAAVDAAEHRQLGRLIVAFAQALQLHLRGIASLQAVPGFERTPDTPPHVPGYVAELIHQTLDRWNRQDKLDNTIWILDVHARALMDVCGACERIRNTPLASSYRSLMRLGILFYVLVSPWPVAMEIGFWGVPELEIAFFFFLAIELTAEDVEEPFGTEKDDLPLENYCESIETFVASVLESGRDR
jgi:putative membrane protein